MQLHIRVDSIMSEINFKSIPRNLSAEDFNAYLETSLSWVVPHLHVPFTYMV